jgi:NAD(P)-dependent dehydrogenase (short-subunit alcohol dehydrogenase family)
MTTTKSSKIDLRSKVGIVTGAAGGIGRAICLALAREGAAVAAFDCRSCKELEQDARFSGLQIYDVPCDVRDPKQVENAVRFANDLLGGIDFLVNNAGVLGRTGKKIDEYGIEEWSLVLDTNLRGTFLMTQAVWRTMTFHRYGKVVCIGSIAGRMGGLLAGPHYCASKAGIHAFVKWAAKQGAPLGIYVNGVAPGPIHTPMIENQPYSPNMVPLGRLGAPADVAEAVLFLVSQASNFITGHILDVNGGIFMA